MWYILVIGSISKAMKGSKGAKFKFSANKKEAKVFFKANKDEVESVEEANEINQAHKESIPSH